LEAQPDLITKELPSTVTKLIKDECEYYVIGTAHVSEKSVEDVQQTIDIVQPDTVVVELCAARFESITQKDRWKKMDIFKVIKEGKGMLLVSSLLLSSFQKKMGEKLGVQPGAEMIEASNIAKEEGRELVLGDRDVQVTLKRVWRGLGFFEKIKMGSNLMASLFVTEEVDEEQLEKMKEVDVLSDMLEDVGKSFPAIKERLIDERDLWLMDSIYHSPGQKVVAVVGAGHVPGIIEHWGETIDKQELGTVPTPSFFAKAWPWLIPLFIIASIAVGFFRYDKGWELIWIWILANGIPCAIGSLIALGHPVTVVASFFAAPFTSLSPLIGAGMVAGLVEAYMRKPTVEDCESLSSDTIDLKGWYHNRITRTLLVMTLSTLGSAFGTYYGAFAIFTSLE
jgi:pheromone shutdown-related protein TraB